MCNVIMPGCFNNFSRFFKSIAAPVGIGVALAIIGVRVFPGLFPSVFQQSVVSPTNKSPQPNALKRLKYAGLSAFFTPSSISGESNKIFTFEVKTPEGLEDIKKNLILWTEQLKPCVSPWNYGNVIFAAKALKVCCEGLIESITSVSKEEKKYIVATDEKGNLLACGSFYQQDSETIVGVYLVTNPKNHKDLFPNHKKVRNAASAIFLHFADHPEYLNKKINFSATYHARGFYTRFGFTEYAEGMHGIARNITTHFKPRACNFTHLRSAERLIQAPPSSVS